MRILILLTVITALLFSCSEQVPENFIMTVQGEVPATGMGQTLSHEHVLVDWIGADSTGYHRWDKDSVILTVLPYLHKIRQLGAKSFVDCSPAYLGRDPYLLRELSEKTGLHILTNTGYYGAVNNRFIPDHARHETAEELAARWMKEFESGIDGSDVKPGFIKIGVKEDTLLSDLHRKLVRAAAITHKNTGLVIKSHTGGDVPAFDQIALLMQKGISPEAFIWTHAQSGSLNKHLEAAGLGAWISLDGVNISSGGEGGNGDWYIGRLKELKREGLLGKVLLSHDAGWYDAGEHGGGEFRSYSDIHSYLVPALLENGFTHDDIDQLLTVNPARAFEVKVRLSE